VGIGYGYIRLLMEMRMEENFHIR